MHGRSREGRKQKSCVCLFFISSSPFSLPLDFPQSISCNIPFPTSSLILLNSAWITCLESHLYVSLWKNLSEQGPGDSTTAPCFHGICVGVGCLLQFHFGGILTVFSFYFTWYLLACSSKTEFIKQSFCYWVCCTVAPCIIPNELTLFVCFFPPFQHFQTMLKSKLNVLTLKKEPLPAVIFHEPEAIELCTTTPLMKTRTHSGCKVWGTWPSGNLLVGQTKGCIPLRLLFKVITFLGMKISND